MSDASMEFFNNLPDDEKEYALLAVSKLLLDMVENNNDFVIGLKEKFNLNGLEDKYDGVFELWDLAYSGISSINKPYI